MSLAYLICTNPRSGSTLLCQGLTHTRRAGAPDEFFERRPESVAYWMYRFGVPAKSEFADTVFRATSTSNGVFGAKLHWTTRPDLHQALRDAAPPHSARALYLSMDELLRVKFSTVRYIWLRRQNKVAQGISHFRADRSNIWQVSRPHGPECIARDTVEFDFRRIDHCVMAANEYDRRWEAYFAHHKLRPFELVYEDFVAAYDAALRGVLDYLDVPHGDLPKAEPHLERMADAKSFEWEKRYREMKAESNGRE